MSRRWSWRACPGPGPDPGGPGAGPGPGPGPGPDLCGGCRPASVRAGDGDDGDSGPGPVHAPARARARGYVPVPVPVPVRRPGARMTRARAHGYHVIYCRWICGATWNPSSPHPLILSSFSPPPCLFPSPWLSFAPLLFPCVSPGARALDRGPK